MKFNLGQVVMTRGIADTMESNEVFKTEVDKAFEKYANCDWGDTFHTSFPFCSLQVSYT